MDAWIIQQEIDKRERERERPRINIPLFEDPPCEEDESVVKSEPPSDRGVFIIRINGDEDE